ncbi:30S ribosomal subunit protein S14 [Candidatus Hodgkinia cicadicola]|uniref:Small ribosomal subunit protein uS14 n=1 Tax=Candidatus Hodgkinia cicadicola TaxID=573658 RepID=A0ABX4MEU5_9HYPH|nr:30S ribosomal subunit protein S14 [Candidatus Hodgkinia cicadicola]PIM96498.1 30S ribosomal subunit protein S14 [Candidatus Hodgkinia cicadicola]
MSRFGAMNKCKKTNDMIQKYKLTRLDLKRRLNSPLASTRQKIITTRSLIDLPRTASLVRIRNRCVISGRPRGYYRFFGISRIIIKQLANTGLLPGMIKSSW